MDTRRLNDTMKIGGMAIGAVATLGPVFERHYDSLTQFLLALAPALLGAVMVFVSGLGTRALGTEYQSIADAKAIAKVSMFPPPIVVTSAPGLAAAIAAADAKGGQVITKPEPPIEVL